ncbi:MAG: hypothetical protein PHC34_04500 [Candidatus Gastranaerophilales bacterium]|nr:hypothetical protein [Candidatus Gastranaerophilales bacterium]
MCNSGIFSKKLLKFSRQIFYLLLICFLITPICILPSKAADKQTINKNYKVTPQNSIIGLDINNELNYDYEVYINPDGSFSLPFKSIAKLLDIPVEQNNQTQTISFTTPLGIPGLIDYANQKITFGNKDFEFKKSSPVKLVFLKQGLKPETKDEVFVPVKILNEILETEIISDQTNYSISVKTNRLLKAIVDYNEQDKSEGYRDKPLDSKDIIKPEKKAPLTLDTINIDSQLRFDSTKTESSDQNYQTSSTNNLSQLGFNGTLLGGNYEIKTDIHNSKSPITFGGMSFKYNKALKYYNLELGNVTGLKSNELSVGEGIIGASIGNVKENEPNYRDISGQVEPGSKINVYINDKFSSTLTTQGGYYTLRNLPAISERVHKIKIEEITQSGEIKLLKQKTYPVYTSLQPKGKTKYAAIAGVTGYNNRFFGDNNGLNDSFSKKLAGGLKVSHGLTDKLTLSGIAIGDKIFSLPENQLLNNISQDDYLLLAPYTNSNSVSGQTAIASLNYALNDSFNIYSDFGISRAQSQLDNDIFKKNPAGYSASVGANFSKPHYSISGNLFDYSPGFYLAGSSGFVSDSTNKTGGELSGNLSIKSLSLNGSTSRYSSALANQFVNGKYIFNEYNLNAGLPLKDGSSISLLYGNRTGKSPAGLISNKNYTLNYGKKLNDNLYFNLTGRSDIFSNKYSSPEKADSNNYSNYKVIGAKLDYDMPKNLGKFSLMHDIVKTATNNFKSDYNAIRIGYTFPTFKNISSSVSAGYHYTGLNKGFDFSSTVGYQFTSGRKLELTYNFNRLLGSFVNNIFIPTSSHSSFTFNTMDALCLIAGGVKSIGFSKNDNGYIQAVAFLDLNQNGIKEDNETAIPNIPISLLGFAGNSTNKKGEYITKGLSEGVYQIRLNLDKLPGLLAVSPQAKDSFLVKVDKKQKSKVFFGLISSIGSVAGKVNIWDEFKRKIDIKDLIVSIFNEKGEEVKYTSIDDDGNYFISGLAPGKYTMKIDKNFVENYHLKPKDIEKEVIIPPSYKDYVDLKDINVDYIQM